MEIMHKLIFSFQPIFTSFAQMGSLEPLSNEEYNKLQAQYADDLVSRTYSMKSTPDVKDVFCW